MNGTTILVVEDEPLVGLEIQDDLLQQGYRVPQIVTNGDEVQTAVDRYRPDLVLMDIRIPGTLDGVQAAARLRQSSDVPVLFVTAYSDPETVRRAAEILPDGYIIKPFGERELAASVELALHKARSPVKSAKNLKKMIPLLDALETVLVLFDAEGRWVHGNRQAVESLGLPPSAPGPTLPDLLGVSVEEFHADPGRWAKKSLPWSVETLPSPEGRLQGFIATMSPGQDVSSQALNQTLKDLIPRDGLFAQRMDSVGFLLPSRSGTGDFYDVFPLGPHHFVFYSLDVEGSGPLPAMVVYALRSAIRELAGTYLSRHGSLPSPSALLRTLNDKFEPRGEGYLFFTMTLGILAPMTGEFELVRAGHTRPLWLSADGTFRWIEGEGSALGAFPEVSFRAQTGRLQAGDRLLLCTDGLIETLGHRDLDVGYSVLAELATTHVDQAPSVTVEAIRQACLEAAAEHRDDISLLILAPKLW